MNRPLALITGASRGIGRASALQLAEAGYDLLLVGRDSSALQQVAAQCTDLSATVQYHALDVTDQDAVTALFRQLKQPLHTLVHCAGQMQDNLLAMTRLADAEYLLRLNSLSSLQFCQLASRLMQRQKAGCIVLLGSAVAEQGAAGQAAYAASKGALSAMTRALAKELGPVGIRINCVAPGFIETDLTAHYSEQHKSQLRERISLGRLGQADDVAQLIRFLSSDAASYITGQVLAIDGGLSL